ncbi:hypothetical protein [Altererythrobacter sp.]|uniref:hypothetical protein n=1 Tax=Altererythrobacter sp. TaxID=1872480 RepID=UPI003D04B065
MADRNPVERLHPVNRWAWPATLAVTTLSGTVLMACLMPFVAVATLAAASMRNREALYAVVLCWLGNQALGFGVLGYPRDAMTVAAGISLLVASLAVLAVARHVVRGLEPGRLAIAAIAGFATFEVLLAAYAALRGDMSMFTADIVALVGLSELVWFGLLTGLLAILTRATPRWFAPDLAGLN